jgi:epoxyqueuosine reductase
MSPAAIPDQIGDCGESRFGELLARLAQESGFAAAGIAAVPALGSPEDEEGRSRFTTWIDQGHAGSMEYLKRRNDQDQFLRSSVRAAFPWARSVIVCAANYDSAAPRSIDPAPPTAGWIARYAITEQPNTDQPNSGDRQSRPSDYHKVLLRRLESLRDQLTTHLGPFDSRCFVDTGPVVERVYARYAGLGWIGKNTCLLNQQLGSWLFLGVIVTSLDVASDRAPHLNLAADRCGSCTRCIDACPTGALTPYQMDATRCVAYLTIEHRGPIPEHFRPGIGRQVFGCDICQDVCPWNQRASRGPIVADPQLAPRQELINPALDWLAAMDEADYGRRFNGSPVRRSKFSGFRRNLAIAMGNSGQRRYLPILEQWSAHTDPVLADAARWAVDNLRRQLE